MKIRGDAEKSQLCKEGSYYLPTQPNSNVNGKPYWIQKNGNNAIWYLHGFWRIGKEVNLGTVIAEIYSTSNDAANPYQVTSWKYISSNKQINWIKSNDISVWPKKPRVPQAICPSFILNREDKTIEKVVPKPAREKGVNCGLSPFHLQKINNIFFPFHYQTICSDNPHPRKTGVKGDCPLLPPTIHLNRENKTISAMPFPAPEKGDNRGLSPFHPKKIIHILSITFPLFIIAIYFIYEFEFE